MLDEKLRSIERPRDLTQHLAVVYGRVGSKTQMDHAILFLASCWIFIVLITQMEHHTFLVCLTLLIN